MPSFMWCLSLVWAENMSLTSEWRSAIAQTSQRSGSASTLLLCAASTPTFCSRKIHTSMNQLPFRSYPRSPLRWPSLVFSLGRSCQLFMLQSPTQERNQRHFQNGTGYLQTGTSGWKRPKICMSGSRLSVGNYLLPPSCPARQPSTLDQAANVN